MNGDLEWRWADPSGQQRRVRTDELRAALSSGAIAPNTPVWRDGWTEWQIATDVPELTTSALAAANGVVPNIPPPPMNVVAAQHAFEGDAPARPSNEPPPPPKYIPLGRPPLHTPSQPMRGPGSPGHAAPHYSVNANTAVNIRALNEGDAAALIAKPNGTKPNGTTRPEPGAKARESQSPEQRERETVPNPAPIPDGARPPQASRPSVKPTAPPPPPSKRPPPPAIGLPSLVRTAPPPPVVRAVGSKPPPPPTSGRGGSKTPPPPTVEKAGKELIEELSGSVLLADTSGMVGAVGGASGDNSIEELSGSILLPDQSGAIQTGEPREKSGALLLPDLSGPAPVVRGQSTPELTGNFLLDAGSTGALPSVESTGQILAAKAASRAPFAPAYEPAPPAPLPATPQEGRLTPAPIIPIALPLGSYPPPPPSTMLGVPAPHAHEASAQTHDAPHGGPVVPATPLVEVSAQAAHGAPGPAAPVPETGPLPPAQATLLGVSPPPASMLEDPALAAPGPIAQPVADHPYGPHALPLPDRSSARLHDFRALGHDPRARYALYGFGALGLLVAVGIIGLIVSAVKKPSDDAGPLASANASGASTPTAAPTAPPPAPPPTPGALGGACTLAGAAHVIAPRAVVQSGVEASVVGSRLALGFAAREKDGYAVTIDPSSAVADQTVRAHAAGPIRRLVPIQAAQGLGASADVDRESDFLGGRRTIPAQHPFDLGFGGGGLAWAPYRSAEVGLLWTLEGDDPVEAIRAAPLEPGREDAGWAIAFRRGATIYAGAVVANGGTSLTAKGQLVKVAGLGPQVGSPTVAAQDGAILVAWADRAQPSEPWSLRWMRFSPGEASAEAKAFVPSEGGLGEHAMSPAIAAAGQGRFVMAWTEGPVATHQVRAQTMTGSGVPLGTAMAISDSGVNAGQAQLAILPDGHGVVAYLAAAPGPKTSYEVLATPIVCP